MNRSQLLYSIHFRYSLFFFIILSLLSSVATADQIRPGYLEIKENNQNVFSVLWKVPAKANKRLSLNLELPDNCKNKTKANSQFITNAYVQRWIIACNGSIVEKVIAINGLDLTNTDVLVRMEFMNGISQSKLLTPNNFSYRIPKQASKLQIIATYTWLGITHILMGIDHLLFVFALLLIVKSKRRLLWTITAFTIAHSITLAAATLGFVHVPQQPVEAIIALSILFLAMEIIHGKRGHPGAAAQWPWLVAFIFGLLHGFGFAGALAEVGLPQQAIPLALVFFNVGVELGQLFFVATVVLFGWLFHQFKYPTILARAEIITVYTIGSLATFWLFERISAF